MSKIFNKTGILLLAVGCSVSLYSCKKADTYRTARPVQQVSMNTYDFLKSQNGLYDNLVYLLDKTGLADTVKNSRITFFVPQDISINTAMDNLNFNRKLNGRAGNWTLDSVPVTTWDSLLARYMMKGLVTTDSLQYADGVNLTTLYGYPMNGKTVSSDASGIKGGGQTAIQYSDMNNSRFTRDWVMALTRSTNLRTANGLVHVLEDKHIFGFSSFINQADPPVLAPFKGTPWKIPGRIEAADYDLGGEGLAYHDFDPSNNGGKYRPNDGVDIETSSEGDYDIGWTNVGEWLKYTVNVTATANYKVVVRAASPASNATYHIEMDGVNLTGLVTVPNTNGYQNYTDVVSVIPLTAGIHVMRFYEEGAQFNFTKYTFTQLAPEVPFYGTPLPIPGTIQAADFDKGGDYVGYHTFSNNNPGGKYRTSEHVGIENCSEGGYDVGWTNGGQWMRYTVNVAATGTYNLEVRTASPNGGKYHFEVDEVNVTGTLNAPTTGGYQNWTGLKITINLTAGVHVLKFYQETGGYNIHNFIFSP